VAVQDVRVDDGEIARFIICRRGSRDTLWHGGEGCEDGIENIGN